ncbi:hypothetical protein LINGRAHAP2_LOCUS3209 [Linum grandiflorum]
MILKFGIKLFTILSIEVSIPRCINIIR